METAEQVVALVGNPNVGKSTLFNALTGLNQHTGNWTGKTVAVAQGICRVRHPYRLVDLPGTYSLSPHSPEEEVTRDFLRDDNPDGVVVVCDATCLERNLSLVLQTLRLGLPTVVCVNLMDEAQRKGVHIDLALLEQRLGVPVVATVARRKRTLTALLERLSETMEHPADRPPLVAETAHRLCAGVVRQPDTAHAIDRRIDRVVTGRRYGYPLMILLLLLVLWLTIEGANIPSGWLSSGLFRIEAQLSLLFEKCGAPNWLTDSLVHGAYRVLAWVVSVMLPPMAIFFPLFTLLEDVGYLPRIAYNLDRPFARCHACGKQALTMCMGFGCNAAGVVGCRIIDSPRERLLAVLTNSFVPCNGRFPTLITLITLFFVGTVGGTGSTLLAALLLTGLILLGIAATFAVTRLLAVTVLKGQPSSFTLELPPYRPPQVGRVILRSVLDRTLFVLGRAAAVAAPAGLLIWLLANISADGVSLLTHAAGFLDPVGRLMGLDGAILLAFILGFPANEIVLPLTLMIYMAGGTLPDTGSLSHIHTVLTANGWTWGTALCTLLFSLFHWPCSTTLLTVYKETGSRRWTLLAAALPTALGVGLCMLVNGILGLL